MAKKKRQRISYVLPLASSPGGHRLGVNGLAIDQDHSILYTGGRDGVLCAWTLRDEPQRATNKNGKVNGVGHDTKPTASFKSQIQAHTHWVNDLKLVQNNSALVSASSDVTVKVWRPSAHEATSAHTIGVHSDYVKCLATPGPYANWIASGGLDHKICLWDLNGAGQTLEIDVSKSQNVVKGSIYALKSNGSVLASGGPESVVRLWDPKSGKNITTLVGHTDNIRDILMSDDGEVILTASSDQTVKVWSVIAGRCMHTLTMHNESVWCMYSDDPHLAVFYSGDRSGMIAKTDVRQADEFDEGVSVAVCQDHEGVSRIVKSDHHIWSASSSSSINCWKDVNTEAEIETPPSSPQLERNSNEMSKRPPAEEEAHSETSATNGADASPDKLPYTSVLRLSVTAPHPAHRGPQYQSSHGPPSLRKASEAILDTVPGFVIPIRSQPVEVIEGQNGLIKHIMLNDKKRVLTLDTAGEVVLWDLLKCIAIRSYGNQHLEDVVPEVNTLESIANWCAVDTKTGKLTVMLEENYCFDAEVYADEIDIPEKIEFRDDQRINLGKWVLRNLFATLLDEEIRRDEIYRRTLRSGENMAPSLQRTILPGNITLPPLNMTSPAISLGSATAPRATSAVLPMTPGIPIGVATPGTHPSHKNSDASGVDRSKAENGSDLSRDESRRSLPPTSDPKSNDYFSSIPNGPAEPALETVKSPVTPGVDQHVAVTSNPTSPTDDKDEAKKKSGIFGKKFQMNFPKTLGRKSAGEPAKQASTTSTEEKAEDASDKSSEKGDKAIEDNFYGVIQKIRQGYAEQLEANPTDALNMGITPSLPVETPVIRPPLHTTVIIQEDNPESGGLADQYRGEIGRLGWPEETNTLERVAPMWLGELLLRNQIPYKDTVKVSFILHPHPTSDLPSIASADGNARLNANRMLRAKKVLAYVAERIDPSPSAAPEPHTTPSTSSVTAASDLKPEEYLDLYCNDRKVPPNVTLASLRVNWWKTGGDVVLFYNTNGRRKLKTKTDEMRAMMEGSAAVGGGRTEATGPGNGE